MLAARRSIEEMRAARDAESFEIAWRAFLNAIAKVWVKAERACQHVRNEFEPWQAPYRKARSDDPLLRHLQHAKNADQHTIQELVDVTPGSRALGPLGGGPWHIDKLVLRGSAVVEYRGNAPMVVVDMPPRVSLLPVTDRGITYDVPAEHLGQPLPSAHPVAVAVAGLEFYQAFMAALNSRFFPGKRAV